MKREQPEWQPITELPIFIDRLQAIETETIWQWGHLQSRWSGLIHLRLAGDERFQPYGMPQTDETAIRHLMHFVGCYLRKFVTIALCLGAAFAYGSDPAPSWGSDWSADVNHLYCGIRRTYNIPFASDRNRRGFLSGTVYNSAFVRFSANTRMHGDLIPEDELGRIRFGLLIYAEDFPIDSNQQIIKVDIVGFEIGKEVEPPGDIQMFTLPGEE